MTELPPDTEEPGMEFINLLLGTDFDVHAYIDGMDIPQPLIPTFEPTATTTMETSTPPVVPTNAWGYHNFGDINFDSPSAETASTSSPSQIDPALFAAPTGPILPPVDLVPALSPSSSNTAGSPQSSHTHSCSTTPSTPHCDCTANLYSALGSMQKIPIEVESAIRQARLATKTAYGVVVCPTCSFKLDPPPSSHNGSTDILRGFQNMMLLGTLIPSIVHAYSGILTVVDEEAKRATAERRKVIFKLGGLGGLWGRFASVDDATCGTQRSFGYREMEPAMWRLAVRALLKMDVYGMSGCGNSELSPADPFHLGLKDIVIMMDSKSKARHAFMDAMVDAGIWEYPENCVFSAHKRGETPTCQRIIELARSSVDQLCIA